MFDRTAGVLGFFILAGGDGRSDGPEDHQNGNCRKNGEEDGGVEPTADLTGQIPGDQQEQDEQQRIGEAVAPRGIGRDGGISDRGVLKPLSMDHGEAAG